MEEHTEPIGAITDYQRRIRELSSRDNAYFQLNCHSRMLQYITLLQYTSLHALLAIVLLT